MTSADNAWLVGCADPTGRSMGFLIPIFERERGNARLVQTVGVMGEITDFEPLDPQETLVLPLQQQRVTRGEAAFWAFAFAPDDVLFGNSAEQRHQLEKRLDDPLFARRPMLALEVAEFLGSARRLEIACAAYANLLEVARFSADKWRDLSVLTPDLRRALHQRDTKRFGGIVATVSGEDVSVYGMPPRARRVDREVVSEALKEALQKLAPLYGNPYGRWFIGFAEDRLTSESFDAVLFVADSALAPIIEEMRLVKSTSIQCFGPGEFSKFEKVLTTTKLPTFIAYSDKLDEVKRRVSVRSSNRPIGVEFTIGTSERLNRSESLNEAGFRTIVAPLISLKRADSNLSREASLLRQIIGSVLAVQVSSMSKVTMEKRVVFMRARGSGADPDTDAWTSLYDRVWSLGLSPERSTRLAPLVRAPKEGDRSRLWAAEALFGNDQIVSHPLVNRAFHEARTDAAVFVSATERNPRDLRAHFFSVSRLFAEQGWALDDPHPARGQSVFHAKGAYARFAVIVEDGERRVRFWELSALQDISLVQIDRLRVTCAASPAAVLARLHHRELLVNFRDLGDLPANRSTIYKVFASQFRRMTGGISSRANSHFLALLVHDAFREKRVDFENSGNIFDAVTGPSIGEEVHLVARRIRADRDHIAADLQLVASHKNEYARTGEILASPFKIIIRNDGIDLAH